MCGHGNHRAVTALFRVFGGVGKPCRAEACLHSEFRGIHPLERIFLSLWVPLTLLVAAFDGISHWLGNVAGFILSAPAAFLLVNLLPWALGGSGSTSQWRRWLLLFTVWGVFRRDAGGVTGVVAWSWLVLFAVNAAAFFILLAGRTMDWKGKPGLAWRMFLTVAFHLIAVVAGFRWGWPWMFAGGALIAAVYCAAVLRPGCQWLGPVVRRHPGSGVLVTIDDGPDPHDTPRLLDLLDQHGVKAVFFMIGNKVAAHPELAREVLRRGHEIGNHTMTHPQASFWCAGPWRTWREIMACQKVIEDTTGIRPSWFRAPVGHRNLFTHPIARMAGLEVMAWSRRGFDAVEKDPEKVLARILPGMCDGDIVLLHEATPIAAEVLTGVLASLPPRGVIPDQEIPGSRR